MSKQIGLQLHTYCIAASAAIFMAACGGGGGSEPAAVATSISSSGGSPTPTQVSDNKEERPDSNPGATPALSLHANPHGIAATFSQAGFIDQANPFFKPFGNGRSCATCHQQSDGWSLTPANIVARFNQTEGRDPLFLPLDGANSPSEDQSSLEARRAASSLLLTKGLIRIGLPMPKSAEFELVQTDDPYGYASSKELSLYRRPLPTTNLSFATDIMWDGRQTHHDNQSPICIAGTSQCFSTLIFNLGEQSNEAILGHAQASKELTQQEQQAIVDFERSLFTAQIRDADAGDLSSAGASGGVTALSKTKFYFGINDADAGDYQTKKPFTSRVMTMYDAWNASSTLSIGSATSAGPEPSARQKSIARGQNIFNNRPIIINNVGGMKNASVRGSCATCHNTPNTGSRSTPLLMNLGLSDASRRTSDMPLYTFQHKVTGELVRTTDPGAALQSGKWKDIGRFKVPTLRGLAARPPYFHDGSASDLDQVVRFYNDRFQIGLSAQDVADLTAFLQAL